MKLQIWDKQSNIITSTGTFTAEYMIQHNKFSYDDVLVLDFSGGIVLSIYKLDELKKEYGISEIASDAEALELIKAEMNRIPESETPQPNTEQILQNKLNEIKAACNETIYSGVDVETSQGKKHFSLLDHDQMELLAQKSELEKALAGLPSAINTSTGVPYHADGELCRFWSVEDFWLIADTAVNHIFYNRTYCNHLLVWAKRAEPDELDSIHYGAELPPDLAENIFLLLQMAGGEQS